MKLKIEIEYNFHLLHIYIDCRDIAYLTSNSYKYIKSKNKIMLVLDIQITVTRKY